MRTMIPVVLAADDNYVPHLAVTMLSAAASAADASRFTFYVLDAGITEGNRHRLEQLAQSRGVALSIIQPQVIDLGAVDLKRYGIAAIYRILVGEILPETVSKIIYLDCDIVVLDDLSDLFATELNENAIAAVENLGQQPAGRLGLEKGDYFNSGVLVLDLEQWRAKRFGQQVLAYMRQNAESLVFPDQDGLNAVLRGHWQRLPLRWNQQPATYSIYHKLSDADPRKATFFEAIRDPAVVHFLGRNKPWDYLTFHPLGEFYWHFLDQTPWAGRPMDNRTGINVLRKAVMVEKWVKMYRRRRLGPSRPQTAE